MLIEQILKPSEMGIPTPADPFRGHVGKDLEEDIEDVEDKENFVVFITYQAEISLETSQLCVTYNESIIVRLRSFVPHRWVVYETYRYLHDQ